MKSRVVLSVLAVIGSFALTATAAEAAGGAPFPLTSFFVCHGINGQVTGPNVDVQISRLGVNPQNVKIGGGVLACVVAKLLYAGSPTEILPNPSSVNSDGLKCYAVAVPKKPDSPTAGNTYQITDDLVGVESGVTRTGFRYVCSPATFSPD